MKLLLSSTFLASASAFAPAQSTARSISSLYAERDMSKALPFAPRPKLLDGSLAGDCGFDPFNFAGGDKATLLNMREAEIKHGRLAMLAAVGWPLAELFDGKIAGALGLESALTSTGASPSVLNGG